MSKSVAVSILLVTWLLLLAGCQGYPFIPANPPPPPTCEELTQQEESSDNFPFETIARKSAQGYAQLWPEDTPALLVLTGPDEVAEIAPYIRKETDAALQDVDFDTYLVVAAFSGVKGHGAWGFCITSITERQGVVYLHTHLVDSPTAPDITASYYHLISLPREALPAGDVTFALALTRHDYVNPTGIQRVLQTSEEETVTSVTRSLP